MPTRRVKKPGRNGLCNGIPPYDLRTRMGYFATFAHGKRSFKELIARGSKLQYAARAGAGIDNFDVEYLDKIGLNHLEENDCGACYGYNWRHFGAEYTNCKADYTGQGFDQLKYVIDLLRNNPYSRRIFLSAELRQRRLSPPSL